MYPLTCENLDEQGRLHKEFAADRISGCSLICGLFANILYFSSMDQEISLVPDWAISRLSAELGVKDT